MTKLSAGDSERRWSGRSVGGLVRVEGAVGAEAGRIDDGSDGRQRVDDLTTFYFRFGDRGDSMAVRDGSVAREIGTP